MWSLMRPSGVDFHFEINRRVHTLIRVVRVVKWALTAEFQEFVGCKNIKMNYKTEQRTFCKNLVFEACLHQTMKTLKPHNLFLSFI